MNHLKFVEKLTKEILYLDAPVVKILPYLLSLSVSLSLSRNSWKQVADIIAVHP